MRRSFLAAGIILISSCSPTRSPPPRHTGAAATAPRDTIAFSVSGSIKDQWGNPVDSCGVSLGSPFANCAPTLSDSAGYYSLSATMVIPDWKRGKKVSAWVTYKDACKGNPCFFDSTQAYLLVRECTFFDVCRVNSAIEKNMKVVRNCLRLFVAPDRVNVRSSPSTDSVILSKLERLQRVTVIGRIPDWTKVVFRKKGQTAVGWIYSSLLSKRLPPLHPNEPPAREPDPLQGWVAKVESSTSWSGFFGNRTVDGFGDREVSLPGGFGSGSCLTVQKSSAHGHLRVKIGFRSGSNWISKSERVDTYAAYGVVVVCAE